MIPSRMHPALSSTQGFALLSEAQSVKNLLRDAEAAIRALREPNVHGDAVFTLGSIGVEKLAKMMIGCAQLDSAGRWPSKDTMKGWGHDIEGLVEMLFATADENQPEAVATDYAASLIARVRESTSLPLLFATLSRYGRSGRFHYLDILATGREGGYEAPSTYWDRLERATADSLGGYAAETSADFERFLTRVAAAIADELNVWWFAMHRLGMQGCFGSVGKKVGVEIWPFLRPDPLRR